MRSGGTVLCLEMFKQNPESSLENEGAKERVRPFLSNDKEIPCSERSRSRLEK